MQRTAPLQSYVKQWVITDGTLSDRVALSNNIASLTKDGFVSSICVNLTITNASREHAGVY